MKRLAFVFLLLLAPIVPARAEVLPTFSYQGVLTDPLGAFVPDGLYDITFRLYDAPVAGNLLFTEPHTGPSRVDVRRGHFSVVIGSLVSMHLLDFANPYWLGIQIGADPELTPRVQLTAAPYAIGLKLPFAGTTVPGGPNNLQIANHGNEGTSITLGSENAEMTVALQPDVNGIGGFLQVPSDAIQSNGFYVDGNSNGSGQPAFAAFGSTRLFYYDGSQSGDPAVQVPAGSISAFELGNEPGIAQNHLAEAQVNITSTTVMQDVVTVTISTPADGYVVVEASAQHGILGTAPNLMSLQIDQTAGGSVEGGYYFFSGRN